MKSFDQLLIEYRSIWNNRLLSNEGEDSEKVLLEAIKRDINDENSHPRIRKNKFEKYYLSTKRIVESTLPDETKVSLIDLHTKFMD
jgi:hypothetical protein